MMMWNKITVSSMERRSGKSWILGKIEDLLKDEGYEVISPAGMSPMALRARGIIDVAGLKYPTNLSDGEHVLYIGKNIDEFVSKFKMIEVDKKKEVK